MEREARLARNEALFREVNEQIARVELSREGDLIGFICECSQRGCTEIVSLTRGDYEALRQHPARFAVVAGHEDLSIERIVARTASYLTVEKTGEGAAIVTELDPRSE